MELSRRNTLQALLSATAVGALGTPPAAAQSRSETLRHVAGAGDAHSSFADYARRWPVWRPGCSDDDIPTGQIRPGINLLDAGAFGEATDPWQRIVAMAGRYVRLRAENAAWLPETLAGQHV